MSKARNYCAVIGDLVRSRENRDRAGLQKRFIAALSNVNRSYADVIVAEFGIIRGDECEALLSHPGRSYSLMLNLQKLLWPQRIRFGVGVGVITTRIKQPAKVGRLDGPAFYLAREAFEAVQTPRSRGVIALAQYAGLGRSDDLINALLRVLHVLYSRMTARQRQVFEAYREHQTMEAVAERLRVSKSTISGCLSAVDYVSILDAEARLRTYLEIAEPFAARRIRRTGSRTV
jgi:predicted DNA-binding protein YlxM (UPF0122 family)